MKKFLHLIIILIFIVLSSVSCSDIIDLQTENKTWQVVENGIVVKGFDNLQDAVNFCNDGENIILKNNCIVTNSVKVDKNLSINGQNYTIDISRCLDEFINVEVNAKLCMSNLILDSKSVGFEVDYNAVTYKDFNIPLKKDTLDSDIKCNQSAIISRGEIWLDNVNICNRYTESNGGAVQILEGSANFINCNFTHNYGLNNGGAFSIGSNFENLTSYPVDKVTIKNCNFKDNYSKNGGAIFAYNVTEIFIENTTFFKNVANGGKGGAIDLYSQTKIPTTAINLQLDFIQTTIKNCMFKENWAGNDGFAIQSYDSDLYVYDSKFIGNVGVHPSSSVGTVSIESFRNEDTNWRIYTLLKGCAFEENKGPCSVYGDHSTIVDLDIEDCIFKNNEGLMSLLLYSATTNMSNSQFIGEIADNSVIYACTHENYKTLPLLVVTDVTFSNCTTPSEIISRRQRHDLSLNTYIVKLNGTTNGNVTIWDNTQVFINGNHAGNVFLDFQTAKENLIIANEAKLNGIIIVEPKDVENYLGEDVLITIEAIGQGLTYSWYYKDENMNEFNACEIITTTYGCKLTENVNGRQVYCVISDSYGNQVKSKIAIISILEQ